jgi:hypothetical protein
MLVGVPFVVGLANGGVVCGRRGVTCSITLAGRCIRGCLLASTSSRICKSCCKKLVSRSTSAGTTLAPFKCGGAAAAVDIMAGRRFALRQLQGRVQYQSPK